MGWVNVPSSVLVMLVLFAVLGFGVLAVAYGTVVRNGWGINLDRVSCPRCGAPLPRVREPQTVRQILWGGWTCQACGDEVDKWGRALAPAKRRGGFFAASWVRLARHRKSPVVAGAIYFILTLFFDWMGVFGEGFPHMPYGVLVGIGFAIVGAVVFAVFDAIAMNQLWKWLARAMGDLDSDPRNKQGGS